MKGSQGMFLGWAGTYPEILSFRNTSMVAVIKGLEEARLEVGKPVRRKCLL